MNRTTHNGTRPSRIEFPLPVPSAAEHRYLMAMDAQRRADRRKRRRRDAMFVLLGAASAVVGFLLGRLL